MDYWYQLCWQISLDLSCRCNPKRFQMLLEEANLAQDAWKWGFLGVSQHLWVTQNYRFHNEHIVTIPSFKNTLNSNLCMIIPLIHTSVSSRSSEISEVLSPESYWSFHPWQFCLGVSVANCHWRSTWMSSVLSLRRVVAALRCWMWCEPADWRYHWVGTHGFLAPTMGP